MPGREESISKFRELIGQAQVLLVKAAGYAEIAGWRRKAKMRITFTFGEGSSQAAEFDNVVFDPRWALSGRDKDIAHRAALRVAKPLLESMADEVRDYWDEDGNQQ